jgi:hypothetical protein
MATAGRGASRISWDPALAKTKNSRRQGGFAPFRIAGNAPMRNPPKITVEATGSLVVIEFRGHITVEVLQVHAKAIDALPARVQPRFTVLTDLTDLESMDIECAPILSRIMEQLSKMGVARVVRVIPDPTKDIGLGILSFFHLKSGIKVNTVPTRAEAKRLVG